MTQYFGEESTFNEKVTFFRNVDIAGNIRTNKITTNSIPGFDGISAGLLASSKNRIYVSTAGDDANSGLSADDSVRTVSKAAEIARTQFASTDRKSIYISSGDYTENIPIIIPTFCAVIGDSLRTVILRPGNPDVDFFNVREGSMLMNLVFRDNDEGDFTFRYAISYDTSNGKLIVNQSPYALNCSLISTRGRGKNEYSIVADQWTKGASQTPRGCFAYVDGDAVDSISSGDTAGGNLESMVFALLSIITPGIGIHIDNCAYSQIVNVFGIFNTDNILCENGGYASVTNSATNFGINALRAVGFSTVTKSYSQDVGIVTFACASSTGVGSTDRITIAGAATTIAGSQSIVSIVDNGTGDSLIAPSINNLIRIGYSSGETPFVHSATEFQIRKVSDAKTITYGGSSRTAYDVAISPRLDEFFSSPYTSYSTFTDKSIYQLRPSVANSSSHTWEYAGSGTDYNALPKNGGKTRSTNEQVEENYGQVYTSGTNELGDFKVGNFVVLKNQTGEVQFTTPIPIAQIDRITFTSGNTNLIITGAVNDTQMGGSAPSDSFIPTQRAVNVFVSSGTTSVTNKTITLGGNTITGTTAQFNAALTDNDFATLAGSEVLTNKSISGAANTFTNIPNSALTNSTISGVSLGSNLNTLTLNTSGTGLSGSQTYNGTSGVTFTVSSNATSANTASAIVARDSSGNFSANTITATELKLSGGLYDKNNSTGSANQILSSTGSSSVQWINSTSAAVGAATSVSITSENTNATRQLTFVANTSGVDNIRVDTDLTYNPATNLLTTPNLNVSSTSTFQDIRITGKYFDGTNTFGSAGQILSSDGTKTAWINASAAPVEAIPSGTTMLFYQAAAPTGWTKQTTHNDKSLRVVSGTGGGSGGSTAFTSVFTSRTPSGSVSSSFSGSTSGASANISVNGTTLSTGQLANHGHSFENGFFAENNGNYGNFGDSVEGSNSGHDNDNRPFTRGDTTGGAGSGDSHSHGISQSDHSHGLSGSVSSSFSGNSMDFAVQYIDVIICTRN